MTTLTRINLVKQVEGVLDEYAGHMFQGFFQVPHRKDQLVNEVINQLPNSYCVIDKDATTENKRVHCWALEQRLTLETLIRDCMNTIFLNSWEQNDSKLERAESQVVEAGVEAQEDKEPSHWFG